MKKPAIITAVVITVLLLCCCVILLIGLTLWGVRTASSQVQSNSAPNSSFVFEAMPTPQIVTEAELDAAHQMVADLEQAEVPISNLYDLAARLKGKRNIEMTLPAPTKPYAVGDVHEFWVTNTDSHETFKISAELQYVTPHIYFWIEPGVDFNQNELKRLCDAFEKDIYPTNREFFGPEWTPGVDNDAHLYIVMATNAGASVAGYFSSSDEYNPEVHEYSNAHELFLLSADNVELADPFTYGVLAHEFQHMIHWYRDLNEDTWMNEGFSELAALLNGYEIGGFDSSYLSMTDLQLTDWTSGVGENANHYGASFLFLNYFLNRFGEDATKTLIAETENGLVSIDTILMDLKEVDPQTGKQITADDLFADWAVTNYVNNGQIGDGRFVYDNYTPPFDAALSNEINTCPSGNLTDTVTQYGVDYIQITCAGKWTLNFQGQTLAKMLDTDAYSGEYAFWSNKGDESNMTLTRPFDFSKVSGPITLTYQTWFDLEEDYDYAYVEVSTDGLNWDIIRTPSGTDKDLSGNSYGWGYNANSGGWIEEKVDLSDYAGKKVQIRLEYITDAAVHGEGILVDDIQIPELKYAEDFEEGNGGWEGAGFIRINNQLPQTYRLTLIQTGKDGTHITPVQLDKDQNTSIDLVINNGESATLVVSGTTRFTRQPAEYTLQVE